MSEGRVRRSGPVAVLPQDSEVIVAHDAQGGVGFIQRQKYSTHWDRPPCFYRRHVRCVVVAVPPFETGVHVAASRSVADPKTALDTLYALGLSDQGPLEWKALKRGARLPAATARRLRRLVDDAPRTQTKQR